MRFIVPDNGKVLSLGKRLLTIKGGVFETEDKAIIELLNKAEGVKAVQKPKANSALEK